MLCFLLFYSLFASAVAAGEDPSVFSWNFFSFLVQLKIYFLSYTESLHTALVASSSSELRGLEPKCKIS